MSDDPEHTIYIDAGCAPSSLAWARYNLEPKVHVALYGSQDDPDLNTREHILARITPREWLFIEHVCQHPERTDEEIMAALGLQERTVQAYYTHLGRNFHVRSSAQLRHWAFKNRLIRTPDDAVEEELPIVETPTDTRPRKDFDPWVRWY
ncbi:MAG: hypothetical protein JNM62_05935 [Flavobacteriales bacterium]|nr:hypothetical protein [Flavobacteriales bacterium]